MPIWGNSKAIKKHAVFGLNISFNEELEQADTEYTVYNAVRQRGSKGMLFNLKATPGRMKE